MLGARYNLRSTPKKNDFVNCFFKCIEQQRDLLKQLGVAESLKPLISAEDLLQIYNTVLRRRRSITKTLQQMDIDGPKKKGIRIVKKPPLLKRTLNIVQDINGQFVLLLETKSKLASGLKNPQPTIFKGTSKVGKGNWRIDVSPPVAWTNMIITKVDLADLLDENEEAVFSQKFVKDLPDPISAPINYLLMGPIYLKFHKKKEENRYHQNYFSPQAIPGNLSDFLATKKLILTDQQKYKIAFDILQGIKLVHDHQCVHQDIKLLNLLFFNNQNLVKLTDFGLTTTLPKSSGRADASLGFESPEISLAWSDPHIKWKYKYYFDGDHQSYGRAVNEQLSAKDNARTYSSSLAKQYREPHKANDMWACGILLFKLFTQKSLTTINNTDQQLINNHSLLKGLLDPNRDTRFTIDQALTILAQMQTELFKIKRPREEIENEEPSHKKPKLEECAQMSSSIKPKY